MNFLFLTIIWLLNLVLVVRLWARVLRLPKGLHDPEAILAAFCTLLDVGAGVFLALIALGV